MDSVVGKKEKFKSRSNKPKKGKKWEGCTLGLVSLPLRARFLSPQVFGGPSFSQIFAAILFASRPSLGFPGHASQGTYTWHFLEARLLDPSWRLEKGWYGLACSFLPERS